MKYFFRFIFVLVIVGGIVYYLGWIKGLDFLKSEDKTAVFSSPAYSNSAAVDVLTLKSERLENKINSTGTILAREAVSLRSETSGRLTHLHFREGQRVRKNDLLFELNHTELLAELKRSNQLIAVRSDRAKRYKDLVDVGGISFEEYETLKEELDLAISDVDIIQAKLDKMFVHAPFDGLIGFRQVSQGAYISPEIEVTQLFNIDTVLLEFSVPSKYGRYIKLGQLVSFTTQDSDQARLGKIYVKEPKINAETRMLSIRAFAVNRNLSLLPGQFANISLIMDTYEEAILVPAEAVISGEEGNRVYIVNNNRAESRLVELGVRTDKRLHILSGLSPGDSLIVTGLLRVSPGSELDIKNTN